MKLEIITPDKQLFDGQAKSVIIPGLDGSLGILDNHAPMIASLKEGTVKVTQDNNEEKTFEVKGGVTEVLKNRVIILAE